MKFQLLIVSVKIGTFFDMFKGTVDEQQSLPKVQKHYYPKGSLKGEAKRVFFLICIQLKKL